MFGVLMGVLIGINIAMPEKKQHKRLEDLSDEELSVVVMAVQEEVIKRMGE